MAHRIDVEMKMRNLDSQLQQDCAVGIRDVEQCPFDDFLHSRKLLRFGVGEVREVLDMAGEDEHGVPAHRGIGMEEQFPVAEIDDELSC